MRCISWGKPGHEIGGVILELAESYYVRPHHESHMEVVRSITKALMCLYSLVSEMVKQVI